MPEILAEGVRFELTNGFHRRQFSRLVHSTTLPTFREERHYTQASAFRLILTRTFAANRSETGVRVRSDESSYDRAAASLSPQASFSVCSIASSGRPVLSANRLASKPSFSRSAFSMEFEAQLLLPDIGFLLHRCAFERVFDVSLRLRVTHLAHDAIRE